MTLPHTPLRLLKHRTKNTYEPPKARTRRTNHKKNDQKHEPKERPKARTTKRTTKSTNRRTNHEKNDQKHEPKARTTKERPKARTQRTNHEKHDRKARAKKHKPSPNVSSPPRSPGVCKPAYQSHKAQQAPLIASLRPKRNPPLIVAMCRR